MGDLRPQAAERARCPGPADYTENTISRRGDIPMKLLYPKQAYILSCLTNILTRREKKQHSISLDLLQCVFSISNIFDSLLVNLTGVYILQNKHLGYAIIMPT